MGRAEHQSAQMSEITNDCLTRCGTEYFLAVPIWQQWASKGLFKATRARMQMHMNIYLADYSPW